LNLLSVAPSCKKKIYIIWLWSALMHYSSNSDWLWLEKHWVWEWRHTSNFISKVWVLWKTQSKQLLIECSIMQRSRSIWNRCKIRGWVGITLTMNPLRLSRLQFQMTILWNTFHLH
jgi:hypothetical protein